MKVKFLVMEVNQSSCGDREKGRFDTYEEAEAKINATPKDLMGTVEYYILKIWTNSDK